MAGRSDVMFIALDTYSRVGGLQQFNRRVVGALAGFAETTGARAPRVHIMRDQAEHLPQGVNADIRGYGPHHLAFVRDTLLEARSRSVLLVGQLNLLPVAWLARRLYPHLRTGLFVHGIEVWNDPVYRTKRWYEPFLFRSIDRVASVSRFTAGELQRHFAVPTERITIFPNAVDPVDAATSPVAVSARAPVIVVVSRLAQHDRGKNVDAVLQAFARLATSHPDARLEIVGDGVLRPDLEALARSLGLADRAVFLGGVSDAELQACYARARAFVLPSSKEGFGIVYLEAWQHGLPVICGTEGAAKEVVSDGVDGFVVSPQNIEGLAAAMGRLLDDAAAAEAMGRAGAIKVTEHYLDRHFRERLADLLTSIYDH